MSVSRTISAGPNNPEARYIMAAPGTRLSNTFTNFFNSERSGGILLIACTLISLALTNSIFGGSYLAIWHAGIGGLRVEQWINDGLMAVFFLLSGWNSSVNSITANCPT